MIPHFFPQGESSLSEIADIIINATGARGSNKNYAINLAQGLRNLEISESKAKHVFEVEEIVTKMLKGKSVIIDTAYRLKKILNSCWQKLLVTAGFYQISDKKQEDYLKRAMTVYFNMIDTDSNGVITVPEFIKLALTICGENNENNGNLFKVEAN